MEKIKVADKEKSCSNFIW